MTVQCPRCRTQYKIPSARINDPRPMFKCTRCSLVFSSESERTPRGGRSKEDKNLPLPFAKERASAGRKEPTRLAAEDEPTVQTDLDEIDDELEDEPEEADDDEEETPDEDEAGDDDVPEDDEASDADDDAETEEESPAARRRAPRTRKASPRARREARPDDVTEPAFVAQASRDRERALAERERAAVERERAAAERERAAAARERERERERAAAERERERAAAERERTERERAARSRQRARAEELRLRDEEDEEDLEDEGPTSDLDDDDDEPRRPVLRASEGKQRRAPINPRRIRSATASAAAGRSPLRPVAIGVAAIAVVYVGLAVALARRSEAAIETLSQVPVLGRLLGGDHLLVWRLQLTGVDAGLDQIKGGRPAYVVSGRAVNTSNEDLRVIEIEGRLLADGVEQRRQTVYAANQQRKTIQDLSPSEVEMLLKLEPNRRFVIRPGESASFLLVFPNPPPGTTEVTCRVVNARAT